MGWRELPATVTGWPFTRRTRKPQPDEHSWQMLLAHFSSRVWISGAWDADFEQPHRGPKPMRLAPPPTPSRNCLRFNMLPSSVTMHAVLGGAVRLVAGEAPGHALFDQRMRSRRREARHVAVALRALDPC